MPLEQTINAEAKSRLKGILPFAEIPTAVNRWMVTSSTRAEIVNRLLEITDLSPTSQVSKELNKARMKRDKKDLDALKKALSETIDPFRPQVNPTVLFSLKTGKPASEVTEAYLLNVFADGKSDRDQFVQESLADNSRFEQPIKRVTVNNFALEAFRKRNKSTAASAVVRAKGTRDLFGTLLSLALSAQLDMDAVLKYALTAQPACFTHPDGSLQKSDKSQVFKVLRGERLNDEPVEVDAFIFDGMFLIQLLIGTCSTYEALAKKLLLTGLKHTAVRLDFCFDTYECHSIKDLERFDRGESDSHRLFLIGGKQKLKGMSRNCFRSRNSRKNCSDLSILSFRRRTTIPFSATRFCSVLSTTSARRSLLKTV